MDAADLYRQAQGFHVYMPPGPQPGHMPPRPVPYAAAPRPPPGILLPPQEEEEDGSHPARIAHTLTACCRCRQRKTRCDPTLPRCLPCERSGSICEYYDATKGRKIGRNYVVKLQEKVRQLEAELGQYTDEDNDRPRTNEDVVRPGGLVRLPGSDEPPRYLGPSSGIAMTRLVMEQAKAFTDSKRISELIPEVRARRQTRMQSIVMTNPIHMKRKKSYAVTSAHPAKTLPARHVANKLLEVFCQRSQVFWPTLHETLFAKSVDEVFAGDTDVYKNFICRMVFAISLQQLGLHYAGLADSYYLAAMESLEKVIRSKDIKTLQCLALVCQYSLLTPTRVSIYYVVGMATRICQAEGLGDEKTISAAYNMGLMDAQALDMRRRLAYIISTMELSLAYSMGRPNSLARGDDFVDVKPFASVSDENITEEGIVSGPPNEKKVHAIHFFRMNALQSEIKRVLYEKKRPEPRNETHPWFAKMEKDIQDWVDASPKNPAWCKASFTGYAHQLRIFLHRPSPQVPRPSARAATICFDAASYIINLSKFQMEKAATDITWIFVSNLFMCLNILLWAVSYAEIRQAHKREEVDELVQVTLDILEQEPCSQRWPGSGAASNLYSIFARACLQIYDVKEPPAMPPSALYDGNSPDLSQQAGGPVTPYNGGGPPQFGSVFDATPEAMNAYGYGGNNAPGSGGRQPPHPLFRSNSIFMSPPDPDRRYSAYPPESPMDDSTPPTFNPSRFPPISGGPGQNAMPTPPESHHASSMRSMGTPQLGTPSTNSTATFSPHIGSQSTPTMVQSSPTPPSIANFSTNMSPPPVPQPKMSNHPHSLQRGPTFTVTPASSVQQRPLPATDGINDWFSPPPPFMSPYNFNPMTTGLFNDAQMGGFVNIQGAGLGLGQFANISSFPGQQMNWNMERHDSLTPEQQMELMNALENEGLGEIETFLTMNTGPGPFGPTSNGLF